MRKFFASRELTKILLALNVFSLLVNTVLYVNWINAVIIGFMLISIAMQIIVLTGGQKYDVGK